MKCSVFCCSAALVASVWAGAPYIARDSVSLSQSGSPTATIRYRLTGGPAIVTVDIQTNVNRTATGTDTDWVSIGERNFRNVTGDVNLLVSPSDIEDKVITWRVDEFLPDFKALHQSCRAVVRAWAPDAPPDYLVVDLRRDSKRPATDPRVRYYVSTNAFPEADNVQNDLYRTDYLAMRLIKARGKTFRMGSPATESVRSADEVIHNVTFTNADFYCAVYPVTCGQLLNIGAWFKGDETGITDIRLDNSGWNYTIYQYHSYDPTYCSSNQLAAICNWANIRGRPDDGDPNWPSKGHYVSPLSICGQLRTRTGVDFDLPTEAQWEYCCRAGTLGPCYASDQKTIAWYDGNNTDGQNKKARPVGKLQPNAWGLYDMLGNLWEYCLDWYAAVDATPVLEPIGPETGSYRVFRGGNYVYSYTYARAARRYSTSDSTAMQKAGARLIAPVGLKWPTTADNRMLTATYSLDEEKIVTVDVQTNRTGTATSVDEDWVSIGERNFTDVFGDVNCKVGAGENKMVHWRADETWPGRYFADGTIRMVVKKWDVTNPPDYLVIDLRSDETRGSTGTRERYFTSTNALPAGGLENRIYKKDYMVMRRIPAQGVTWCMGSPSGEYGRVADAETQHYVTFTQEDFYCAIYPVTCGQLAYLGDSTNWKQWSQFYDMDLIDYTPTPMRGWKQIRGEDADYDWPSDGHAVAVTSYLGKLSALDGGRDFDIPTDAQWEFLCRAGKSGTFGNGTVANSCGWWDGNSGKKGHEVGLKPANDWGLYDLHGNLWELVLDWYGAKTADPETDPYGPLTGTSRVWRGGQAAYAWTYGRSASRYGGSLSYCGGLYGAFRPITPISGKWPNGGRVLSEEE